MADHRGPGVAGGGQHQPRGLRGGPAVEREDLQPGYEHRPQLPVGDLQRAGDDGALLLGEAVVAGDDVAQLVRADLLAAGAWGSTPARRTTRSLVAPSSHTAGRVKRGQQVQRAGHQQRPPLGALHGDPLRGQLAEDQGDEGQHQGDQHDRDRLGGAAEEPEQRHQRLGQGDRRGGRGEEAGQGDADLDGGQEAVRVLGEPGQHPAGPAGAFQPLDLAVPQRDQRHLAAGEDRVERRPGLRPGPVGSSSSARPVLSLTRWAPAHAPTLPAGGPARRSPVCAQPRGPRTLPRPSPGAARRGSADRPFTDLRYGGRRSGLPAGRGAAAGRGRTRRPRGGSRAGGSRGRPCRAG